MKRLFFLLTLLCTIAWVISCKKEYSGEGRADKNQPPVAIAGPDKIIVLPTDSILLDGSASADADGSITEWLWTKLSGPVSFDIAAKTSSRTVVRHLTSGVYYFELKVTDNGKLSAKDTVIIRVDATPIAKHPPIANAGKDTTITLPATILLDASNSTDPDNNISTYEWIKISGPPSVTIANPTGVQTQVTALTEGIYLFELKVTDSDNLFSLDTMQATVNPANHAPIACAGFDKVITLPASSVILDGSCSKDAENNITGYAWTKISGPASFTIVNATAVQTPVDNLQEGIYLFALQVTDATGLSSKDTIEVLVWNKPPPCTACKVVFVSDRDGNPEIYSCNMDGSNIARLTNDAAMDEQPAWSPDGTRIAFISDRSGSAELYVMNADGSNVVRKTFTGSNSQNPTWSPDGTRIAYSSLSNGSVDLWVINLGGGSPSLLFSAAGWDDQPSWSPDGQKLAFASDWKAFDFVSDIYTINADGTGFTSLTDGNIFDDFDYFHPSWSPGGARLAAVQLNANTHTDPVLCSVDRDGSLYHVISDNVSLFTIDPGTRTSWSPDGGRIVYTSLSGTRKDISWVYWDGSAGAVIVTNGWNADCQH